MMSKQRLSDFVKSAIRLLGDRVFNIALYAYLHLKVNGRISFPNLANPVTFNEKMIYLKLSRVIAEARCMTDKVSARAYVAARIGDRHLVPILGVYSNPFEIPWDAMPEKYIVKASHGSGWNIVCRDSSIFNRSEAMIRLSAWLATDYFKIGRDYSYEGIVPRIIIEQLLEDPSGQELKDYKIFCFNGTPRFIQVDLDRSTDHTRCFYDTQWVKQPFTTLYPRYERQVDRPTSLDTMLEIAATLSKDFDFLRVDLYEVSGNVFFGEMTFHHGGGFEPFDPSEYDLKLGSLLALRQKKCGEFSHGQ